PTNPFGSSLVESERRNGFLNRLSEVRFLPGAPCEVRNTPRITREGSVPPRDLVKIDQGDGPLVVGDPNDSVPWIKDCGWRESEGRHLSERHRSVNLERLRVEVLQRADFPSR